MFFAGLFLFYSAALAQASSQSPQICNQQLDNPLVAMKMEIPWDKMESRHFVPAMEHELPILEQKVKAIAELSEPATYENTITAINFATEKIDQILVAYVVFSYNRISPEQTAIIEAMSHLKSRYDQMISLNVGLFRRIEQVYLKMEKQRDRDAQAWAEVEKTYVALKVSGVGLVGETRTNFIEIDKKINILAEEFKNNLNHNEGVLRVIVNTLSELEGVPSGAINSFKKNAVKAGMPDKYVIEFTSTQWMDVLKYAKSRELRNKVGYANSRRELAETVLSADEYRDAFDHDNDPLILKITALRKEKAQILEFSTYSDFALNDKMLKSPAQIKEFHSQFLPKVWINAKSELDELKEFARLADGITDFKPWDTSYYFEQLRKEKYNFNPLMLKDYFEVNHTLTAVLGFFADLYQLKFELDSEAKVYHPDVVVYRVVDLRTRQTIATLMLDPYARESKVNSGWHLSVRAHGQYSAGLLMPVSLLNLGLIKSNANEIETMTIDEVSTLLHELGHAMHALLSVVRPRSLSGTSVPRDFVEFPSQIMQNFLYEPFFLERVSKHIKSGLPMSQELMSKFKESRNVMVSRSFLAKIRYGMLDLEWYWKGPNPNETPVEFEKRLLGELSLYPDLPLDTVLAGFAHIFSGGYASLYYSYLFSEQMDSQGFKYWIGDPSRIQEKAHSFREKILSWGGTRDPNQMFKDWVGSKPTSSALFERMGITSP